jgi:NAD-dependent dihydropyrimidine dehydrogenase PreA subunit
MSEAVYRRLARVLDTLPNGFPATDSGIELRLLKKIFTPEEADLFCDLKLHMETAAQIAHRTGRSLAGLEDMLTAMWHQGQILGANIGGVKVFKMIPWVVGIYEFQIERMDRDFVEMFDEYLQHFGPPLVKNKPEIMQVVPVKKAVKTQQQAMPYQQVSGIIDAAKSFAVNECICNKARRLKGEGCDKPAEICLGLSRIEGIFDDFPWGRPISRKEALAVLERAEKNALVHLSSNVQEGHMFICNCCGCCCPVLRAVHALGTTEHINCGWRAEIDPALCTGCGTCADERCQVAAIESNADTYRVVQSRCIGCGLCVSTCPEAAIDLVRKTADQWALPPRNEDAWMEARGKARGIDFSNFK